MSSSPEHQYYKVGVLLFEKADILDFTGPMEVLSHVSHNRNPDEPVRMFKIETIARSSIIRAASALTVKVDTLLEDAVDRIADFDILLIPGAPPSVVQPLIENNTLEVDIIRKFTQLPPPNSERPRIVFSICTGAFLLGAAGILAGMTVTTHHRAVDALRDICARFNDESKLQTTVEHKRCIDGGHAMGGAVRVVTAGGISSGLDASFHLVHELASPDMAAFVSRVMEYDWTELEK
ncbi:ThiJ/PfpI family protein [Penicillium capsulatum]|uniref:ThiJ/PfpI family protein n=1 Tax=Penicillium capsulatum TaxID=69766 RepID=A0A9W9ISX7_9EURO|nr:ThiJ/PfpI family protein [Penicillium capsulatum]KAJ6130813.1 ThiJ/PfpI family protein [Penicillium capsulatum]